MSASEPLVSILINNYNYGRFLREAIDSALNQTYRNTEVIVVDDGSTDNSREIIASYGDRIIPVLKDNGGQASAFNAGFRVSKGDLICYLDSDDSWLSTKVERVVEIALSHPQAVFIYHRIQPAAAGLRPIRKALPTSLLQGNVSARVMGAGGWWACPPTSALCLRRRVLERIGPLPEGELRTNADAFLQYVVTFLGPVLGFGEVLTLYRRHGANATGAAEFGEQAPGRRALIAHLQGYEHLVSAANTHLDKLQVGVRLRMEDHWSYQFLKYRTGLPGHYSCLRLALLALCFAGLPSVTDRAKAAARAILQRPLPEGS